MELINRQTGEVLNLDKTLDLEKATDGEVSAYYTLINTFESAFKKERERVRKFVISKVRFVIDEDDKERGRFGDHGFSKSTAIRLDTKALKRNKEDYQIYKDLVKKYPKEVQTVRPAKF